MERKICTHVCQYLIIIMCILLILNCKEKEFSFEQENTFKVAKAKNNITIDGKMDELDWKNTEAGSFEYFYRIEKSTDKQKTTFRMLWDEENLYLFYECEDKYITARETKRDGPTYLDDCAEIFLIPVPDSLNMHFCFEVNLYKTINDLIYINNFYNDTDGSINSYNPDITAEVNINGTLNDNSDIDTGWSMEMAIPLTNFRKLTELNPIKTGTKWAFLAVRQDRNDITGDRRSTSTIFPIFDIEKSVHQPNRFGLMEFIN